MQWGKSQPLQYWKTSVLEKLDSYMQKKKKSNWITLSHHKKKSQNGLKT